LRREINLPLLIAMMIGLNIGGALFVLTAIAAGQTGPSLFIAQIIAASSIFLSLVAYMMFTSAMPTTCASYRYAKLFSRPLAVAAWVVIVVGIGAGGMPLFALTAVKFLQILIPGLPLIGTAIGILVLFYVINVVGIKPVGWVQFGTVVVLLIAIGIFIGPGIPAIKTENLTPLFPGGAKGLIVSSALLYTLCGGGLFGIDIGEETKAAKSTIPKALVISMIVVVVFYLLVEIVAVGVVNWKIFGGESLAIPAKAFLSGPLLGFFLVGGGVLACITTINLIMTLGGRYFLAFSEDGFLPHPFRNINKRFGTPHWGLTLGLIITVIAVVVIPSLQTMGLMLNFGLVFMITLVLLAAYKLPKRHPEIYEKAEFRPKQKTLSITSLIAVAMNIFFMIILAIALKLAFVIFVASALVGIGVYYGVMSRKRLA